MYAPRDGRQRYCSAECRRTAYLGAPLPTLSSGTVGAIQELRVCVDLMARGFHVFRAMSPSCPCDLVAWDPEGRVLRIEVKTAWRHPTSGALHRGTVDRNRFDVVCYVTVDALIYEPDIEAWGDGIP